MVVYLTGTRAACINAATLALADAGIPMRDIVTSCSAGYLCSTPLLGMTLLYILSLERII
ncbi:Os09g0252000 [Oryza sativa Japonica Group]|jgi:exosome complex component RRP41|uniref:Os09g0252000 protein n=1 Tax=Oryza sativa subsp. japonica TaxID=39947 RepID=Q0J367_ORYSJ|nr:Os09g0252000 [Oryza sativa Japonica Group]|eukprot:NP_001062684.2 Os09g0252000 [Oryza sativa Japonica Group]